MEDLQGLFAFLGGPSPLTDAAWWRRTVQAPYEAGDASARRALHDIVERVMWRNSRLDVAAELHLPPQGQVVTWLRPSGIEAHWYGQQRKVCEGAARDAFFRIKNPDAGKRNAKRGGNGAVGKGAAARGGCGAWSAEGLGRRLGGGIADGEDDEFRDLIDDGVDAEKEGEDEEDDDVGARDAGSEEAAAVVDLTAKSDLIDGGAEEVRADRYLTPEESRRVLAPLLRLRQACNHPQAGTHGVRGLAKVHSGGGGGGGHIGAGGIHSGVIMTMPQIHAVLIERQRTEVWGDCELGPFAAPVFECVGFEH